MPGCKWMPEWINQFSWARLALSRVRPVGSGVMSARVTCHVITVYLSRRGTIRTAINEEGDGGCIRNQKSFDYRVI